MSLAGRPTTPKSPLCPEGVLPGHHWASLQWLRDKHGLDEPIAAMSAASDAMEETVEAILHTRAETLYGVGVKLAAFKSGPLIGFAVFVVVCRIACVITQA
jgi:hypothetical protein